jgi:Zn-dependent peptidase ImmA (M78 family)
MPGGPTTTSNLPSRIKIGRRWWTLEGIWAPYIQYGDQRARGLCHYERRHIEVCLLQSDRALRQTLAHELTHAVMHESGVEMSEAQVHGLEPFLAALLYKNPALVKILTAS